MNSFFMLFERVTVFFLLLCTASLAHSVQPAVDDSIVFGMSSPFSGFSGVYGRQMKQGIEAGFAEINETGGLNRRLLKLVALDDGYEVQTAVANTRRLIDQEHVFGLMGFYGTASSIAVMPVVEQAGVPLIGTISGAAALRTPDAKHLFHLRASYDDEAGAIVKNLLTVGISRIAVFYQDDAFGQAGLKGVESALANSHAAPVAKASVPRNSVDVVQAVEVMRSASPQAVVMATLYRPSAAFITQMRQAGVHPYFVALSPVGTDQLVAELGGVQSRGIQVSQVIPYPWGGKLEVVREYKRALAKHAPGQALSYYGLEGYLNARLVIAAIRRTGSDLTRERLMQALRAAPFDLGGYRIKYGPNNNTGSDYVEISVIGENGRILN